MEPIENNPIWHDGFTAGWYEGRENLVAELTARIQDTLATWGDDITAEALGEIVMDDAVDLCAVPLYD